MTMTVADIHFAHRRPSAHPYVAKDFAEFTVFGTVGGKNDQRLGL